MNNQRIASKRLNLLPTRVTGSGPRNGTQVGTAAQQAGDLFWRCGVECFKPVYARIDRRFPTRLSDAEVRNDHASYMEEVKRILQEHRNTIFECVLPMFTVKLRVKDEETTEADEHAHDFFCNNQFQSLTRTLIASLPAFVLKEDVEATAQTVTNLSQIQSERLAAQLLNFSFGFRPVMTPEEAEKKRKGLR